MADFGDLTCKELVELVTDYLEDALSPEERARFEMHLVYCRGCVHYLDQLGGTMRVMGQLSEEQIEPAAREQLLATFSDWKRTQAGGQQ